MTPRRTEARFDATNDRFGGPDSSGGHAPRAKIPPAESISAIPPHLFACDR